MKAAGGEVSKSKEVEGTPRAEAGVEVYLDGTRPSRLEDKLRAAVLRERDRMARDIHDTLAQGFTGIVVQVEAAEDALQRGDVTQASLHLRRVGKLAREGLAEARRSVRALRPRLLEDKSLPAALERLIQQMTPGTGLRAELVCRGRPKALGPKVEEGLLRIGQEALTNTLKHAGAGYFCARLVFKPGGVRLEIWDNGRGFDLAATDDGFGLIGMKERVFRLGGRLTVESSLGRGTRIVVVMPERIASQPAKV